MSSYSRALEVAHEHALHWLGSLGERPVPPQASIEEVVAALGPELPQRGCPPEEAVALLAEASDAGLTATASGRFFGFVVGGTHPAALAADWLVSAWDQNTGLRTVTPAHSAVEDIASAWLLDLLGLPAQSAVGFTTGATMANFTALAAGRDAVLRRAGWDVTRQGLAGGPRVRVLVGAERHDTVDVALRYLGLGTPETVNVDDQGRVRPDALEQALADGGPGPVLVSLQAGNIHSGASDPFEETVAAAHRHDAWVHIDGAFGLWAAASPAYRHLVRGHASADSWATDAHKTLNVPYDSGLCIVRDPAALQAAMGSRVPTCCATRCVSRWTRCPSCPGVAARSPCGRCSGASVATGSPSWSSGCATTPPPSPRPSAPYPASPCSTTWCSPRSARRSARTSAPTRWSGGSSRTAPPG